jgi:hypothetical protein
VKISEKYPYTDSSVINSPPITFHWLSDHWCFNIVHFADKSSLKPSGIGTIRLKLLGLLDFLLHNVLYLPELKRSLLSLVLIRQQGHSVHMISGKVEV